MRYLVFVLLVLLAGLHQDSWWRYDHRTVVFGFVPVTLAYHIGVSIVASILWGLACVYAWPQQATDDDAAADESISMGRGRH